MDTPRLVISVLFLVAIVMILLASQNTQSEKYCCGEQTYTDPEFPTYDHYGTNKWVRYDLTSDNFPFSPYAPMGPYDF